MPKQTNVLELECSACGEKHDAAVEQHLCTCGKPLLAKYDLKKAAATLTLENLKSRPKSLWRYAEVLPDDPPVTLGEGMTPLLPAKRLGASLGVFNLLVKYEDLNPTGSFKARGMTAAVSRAKQLNVKVLAAPTAGNAGGALAAYAAAAGIPAIIVMPADTPSANVMECQAFGAKVIKLNGLISDCGKYVAEHKDREGWYDVSTLKEPYRVEGKKTMGYELWEQLGGKLPDVILYPTGGGVGLIGMCKAFDEMQEMGWIGAERPRIVAVQAAGCAPIVKAWEAHRATAEFFQNAATLASGLRVPGPLGDFLILRMLEQTHGTALSVTDDEMLRAGKELASLEGIFAAPEGAATVSATRKLVASGWIKPHETVVLFNTGTGYKYSEVWQRALQAKTSWTTFSNHMKTHRIYYDDAYEREFDARVMHCEVLPPDVKSGITGQVWGLVLDRTAFYPTSGGQPNDLGKIGDANVLDVRDDGDEITHLVDRRPSSPDVLGCIHWPRRFDHMQQHSGQHLLSAMFQERFGRPTVSFHLGADFCTIDLRGPEPSEEILEGAERAANKIIFEDRPLTVRYGTAEDLAELGVRKEVDRQGILRAIEIEGADLQPCGGTHVKTTGQIGTLLVRRCSKMRQDWRVEFVCGGRAERVARQDFLRLRAAAEKLSCAPEELLAATERVISEREATFKKSRVLLQRLAEMEATQAVREAHANADGIRVVQRVFDDADAETLAFFATEIAKIEKAIALLAAKNTGNLQFSQHPAAAKDMNALLKHVLVTTGGKGGGSSDSARGRLEDAGKSGEALALARKTLAGN